MFRFGLVLILVTVCACVTSAEDFPADVQQCSYSDEACLTATVTQILQTNYKKGHRGLNIIPFDPLHIKSLSLDKIPNSPVNVDFKFKNINLTGLSQIKVTKLTGFTKEATNTVLELHANIPKLVLSGPYKVDGRVLILPIVGEGNSKIVFDDVKAVAKVKCETVEKDGAKYIKVVKIHLDLVPSKMTFDLENLFNNDKVLGDNMNQFLNENWEVVFEELKPLIVEAFGKILVHIANGPFLKFAYTDLFSHS